MPGTELRDGAAGNGVPRLLPGELAAGQMEEPAATSSSNCVPVRLMLLTRRMRQKCPHLTEEETRVCGPEKGGSVCRK